MADIKRELQAIMEAEYGEEVRSSIHDAIRAGNNEIIEYGLREAERERAETERASAENARISAEAGRKRTETERVSAENTRNQNENERHQAEERRDTEEGKRLQAERIREQSESVRVTAETERDLGEAGRQQREDSRISAENERTEAETLRDQAEELRKQAEAAREAAEELREAAKAAAEAAAEAANDAAEKANAAAEGGVSNLIVNIEETEASETLESGDTVGRLFGKIKKWIGNLSSGAGSTLLGHLFSHGKALISDAEGKITESEITSTDLEALSGISGNIQNQLAELNGKIPAKYAGSASAGGSATSAVKLDTATAGSATQPVYFSGGKPVACTHTLAKSVPANAVFTDTNTWRDVYNVLTSTSKDASLTANMGRVLATSKAEVRKTGWGKSLTISASSTGNLPHGIVMFCNNVIYGLWVAGNAGSCEANITLLHGDNVLTFSCDRNTGAVTVRAASDGGFVYIGA